MTKGDREQTGGDMEIIASRCNRRSGRRLRQRKLKRKEDKMSVTATASQQRKV